MRGYTRKATAEPSARWERKFVPTGLGLHELLALIRFHPAVFREIYAPRYVNNIYFDTPDLDHYQANVRGVSERMKCRVRWYGEPAGLVERPALELKRKHGLVGTKRTYPLEPFKLEAGFAARELLSEAVLPGLLGHQLANLVPILINRYRRRYFLSADGGYRLTVDTELGFRSVGTLPSWSPSWGGGDDTLIVELKFAIGREDGASRIANAFPFRLSRSSKYVRGVELLYGR